jgi:hypothetical protein
MARPAFMNGEIASVNVPIRSARLTATLGIETTTVELRHPCFLIQLARAMYATCSQCADAILYDQGAAFAIHRRQPSNDRLHVRVGNACDAHAAESWLRSELEEDIVAEFDQGVYAVRYSGPTREPARQTPGCW